MRAVLLGCAMAAALAATPACAGFVKPTGKIILFQPTDTRADSEIPTLAPGEEFAVNCGCMDAAKSDVRVILDLAGAPDEAPTGYRRLLATDQHLDHGALRVRVPDAPGLSNHTVDVQVYVVSSRGARACDAGRVRIS